MTKLVKKLAVIGLAVVMMGSITGCAQKSATAQENVVNTFKAGTYTAEATGKNGPVKVEVTFSETAITEVKVIEHHETPGISDTVFSKIPEKIMNEQSLAVDVITGASTTSNAVIQAVEDCVVQAGGNVDALKVVKEVENENKEVEEVTYDVVVVGAGASGSAAALSASLAGANVLLLEKTASPMGSGTLAGGMFAADSSLQKEAGEEVDKEWLYEQYVECSQGYMNSLLVRHIIDESGRTVDFLLDNGVNLNLVASGTGAGYIHQGMPMTLHGYADGGTVAINTLIDRIKETGGTVMFSTPATELIQDESGKVVGVMAKKEDGGLLKVNAQSVILATGGFGGNEEMLREYYGDDFTFGEVRSNTGDGIQMAWNAGADEYGVHTMHYFWETFSAEETEKLVKVLGDDYFGLTEFTFYPHLRLNKFGQRFCDETKVTNFALHGAEVSMQPNAFEWLVLDDSVLDQVAKEGYVSVEDHYGAWKDNPYFYMEFNEPNDTAELYKQAITPTDYRPLLDAAVETGVVVKADTIEELAALMGADADTVKASIKQYNGAITTGKDEVFFADLTHMPTISEGPYYAVKYVARNLSTLGGVRVNENLQAVDGDGQKIEGLYVVGVDAGGMYGKAYVDFEGGTLGFAYTSGKIAGENAAKTLTK